MRHWFLPETPDVLGVLARQVRTTIEGVDAFAAWAAGDASKATVVRSAEHEADKHRRELQKELREAFSVPLDAEDLYELSQLLDAVLNGAKNAVREAEVMEVHPDAGVAAMAGCVAEGVRHLADGFLALDRDNDGALRAADAAIASQRALERAYRAAMSEALRIEDVRELFSRRELYRRCARLGDGIVAVAERIWYAVVKQG